ncbi:MAG: hypothetical protein CSA07_05445 [Bacteroidia bacterium]|nr:MAG: hypothetical protein CSA07_05445 [Bacteroidia bacterium]
MRRFPSLVLTLTLAILATHAYYSYPWSGPRERVLNPALWENPYSYFENYRWMPVGGLELSTISCKLSLDPDGGLGLGYLIDLHARYRKGDTATHSQVQRIRTVNSLEDEHLIAHAPRVPSGQTAVPLRDYLLRHGEEQMAPRYPHVSGHMWLAFRTGLVPPKYLEFTTPGGESLRVNTNPLFLLRESTPTTVIALLLLALGLYLLLGYPTMSLLLMLPPCVAFTSDYQLWCALLYLCVVAWLVPMRMHHISARAPLFRLLWRDWLTTLFVALTLMVYLFVYHTPAHESWFWRVVLVLLFMAFIILALWGLFDAGSLLYIHFRYRARRVVAIELSNPVRVVSKSASQRRFPEFFCDVAMEDPAGERLRLPGVQIHLRDYRRLVAGRPVRITRYRTDGRGSYIFY